MDIPEPVVTVHRVTISCIPGEYSFTLFVDFRNRRGGVDWYSVTDGFNYPNTLDRHGKWAREQKPTSHSPSWRKARQFTLDEAIEIAKRHAPNMTVNGFTIADGLRFQANRRAKSNA
jgi:hypothetical protein